MPSQGLPECGRAPLPHARVVTRANIPLDVNALFAVYDEANKNAASGVVTAAASTGKTGRSTRKKAEEAPATTADKPQDKPADEQAVNNTPEQETPQEAVDKAEEKQPEQAAEQQDTAAPAEEEKPRRKRKARD